MLHAWRTSGNTTSSCSLAPNWWHAIVNDQHFWCNKYENTLTYVDLSKAFDQDVHVLTCMRTWSWEIDYHFVSVSIPVGYR